MRNKLKLTPTMICTLIGIGSFSIANATEAWSTNDLSSYVAGSTVTDNGKTYKCKGWPASGWCQIAAYKPSGTYGSDAWDVVGSDPNPQPEPTPTPTPDPEPTPSPDPTPAPTPDSSVKQWDPNTVYNPSDSNAPSQAIYDGNLYTAKWWTRGENPAKSGQWGVWKNEGPIAEQGKATVSVVLPAKPNFIADGKLADVQILKNGVKVAETKDAKWGSTTNLDVTVGDSAELTVSVPAIDGATGSASPASFTLVKDASQTVSVEYTAPKPAEEGSIKISADSSDVTTNVSTTYTLTNSEGNVISSGNIEINKALTLDHIPSSENGVAYTLTVGSFTTNGYNYTPVKTYSVVVYNFNTSNINVSFDKKAIPTENVSISVSGLPEGKDTTLTLSNDKGDSKEIVLNSNTPVSVEIPKDGSIWSATIAAMAGYTLSVSPSSFSANQDNQQLTVNVTENTSSNSDWPNRVVVGYVRGYDAPWQTQPNTTNHMISEALHHGYNVLVYSFIGQNDDGTVFFDSDFEVDGMKLQWDKSLLADLPNQMKTIHQNNGIALVAIGGGVNFFMPDMSGDKAVSAGKTMGKFIAEHNFDGLDIDVEHPVGSAKDDDNFLRYIEATRAEYKKITGKDMFLTAAPQISGWYGSGQWASGYARFAEPFYTQDFMDRVHFDAVFIQTYNQYGGAIFDGKKGQDVGFLSMTFKLLGQEAQKSMPGLTDQNLTIPSNTKIVLGVPNYRGPSVTDAQYKQGLCLADASCSGSGLYNPVDITTDITNGGLGNYEQYGGLMTWIMNSDSYQGWTWVDGVKNIAYN